MIPLFLNQTIMMNHQKIYSLVLCWGVGVVFWGGYSIKRKFIAESASTHFCYYAARHLLKLIVEVCSRPIPVGMAGRVWIWVHLKVCAFVDIRVCFFNQTENGQLYGHRGNFKSLHESFESACVATPQR